MPSAGTAATGTCRVLLAEDNAVNALLARRMLEKSGCEVVHAINGAKAVEAMRQALETGNGMFDIVLMDVHMPVLDGLEAAAAIRKLWSDGHSLGYVRPAIVALTANAFAEDRQRCLEAGLEDYLAKPFQREELQQILSRWRRGTGQIASRRPGAAA